MSNTWWKVAVRTMDEGNLEEYYAEGSFLEVIHKAKKESERRILAHEDGFMIESMRRLFWGEKPNSKMIIE